MKIMERIKHILYADHFISVHRAEQEQRSQRGIALIAIAAFVIMSILNIRQHSIGMLITTGSSAFFLTIAYFISLYRNKASFLKIVFYIIFIGIFTDYIVMGGNEGFSALWLIIATYAVMIAIDFKAGFIISVYYLVMLLLVFIGPLTPVLQYDYNQTFRLRFPFLYAINFAFATYIIIRIRLYQYDLLLKQQELEYLSNMDLSTGLKNRNNFIKSGGAISAENLKMLSAVFIDVNGLHEVNNREGHDAGDQMLRFIADLCKKYFPLDSIYRMGGDEFLILCQNENRDKIEKTAHRVYEEVEQAGYSISYGIEVQEDMFDVEEIVKNADTKMMEFKREYYKTSNRRRRL